MSAVIQLTGAMTSAKPRMIPGKLDDRPWETATQSTSASCEMIRKNKIASNDIILWYSLARIKYCNVITTCLMIQIAVYTLVTVLLTVFHLAYIGLLQDLLQLKNHDNLCWMLSPIPYDMHNCIEKKIAVVAFTYSIGEGFGLKWNNMTCTRWNAIGKKSLNSHHIS